MEEIYAVGGRLNLAITLRDDLAKQKSGRVYIDTFCRRHAIPLLKVRNINDGEAVEAMQANAIDWLFIIGWSQIARLPVLQAPTRGVLGIHPTLLPVGRGRAAIPWAIFKGLPETGVTLFQLDEGVDTGPVLAQERLPLAPDETATRLYQRVAIAHRTLIRRIWSDLAQDRLQPVPQDESKATIWPGRTPTDGRISADMNVAAVDRLVRATTHPYPGAFWEAEGKTVRIWQGRIGAVDQPAPQGALRLYLSDGAYDATDYEAE